MSKQYGLIIHNKKGLHEIKSIKRPAIFDEDSDSDTPAVSKPTGQTKSRKQDKINENKAVDQDPTVYQYDEVYDEMDQKRKESKLSRKDLDKKPKYITKLLVTADRRKRENERRIERQVQKEREAEGEEFKDKESFVTSAYKQKLEEMKELEEQEKREEYLESIGDVTKQGNLDGFYRHLYDQKVNYNEKTKKDDDKGIKTIKEEEINSSSEEERGKKRKDEDNSGSDQENKKIKNSKGIKTRRYRSRKDSAKDTEENSSEEIEVKKEHLPSNLDADSDFSIDSSDCEDEAKDEKEQAVEKFKVPEKGNVIGDNAALAKAKDDKGKEDKEEKKEIKEIEEVKPKKPKVDLWKKRTVGEVFDEAVKRYFERKSLREATRNV